ncbi:MAG: DUF4019 domain-containing protein [Chthoniobacterales bacterium]
MIRAFLLSAVIGVAALLGAAIPSLAQSPSSRPNQLTASDTEAEKESARQIASDWLDALDQGKTAASFRALSPSATASVAEAQWQEAFAKKRQELGVPKGRSFHKMQLFRQGDGRAQDFYLLHYNSVSVERGALHEIVTVALDADGSWHVAGYQVEPRHQGGDEEGPEDVD